MLSISRRRLRPKVHYGARLLTFCRPLAPAELQVLRDQYEKEGDMVGIQTKFNYAWVGYLRPLSDATCSSYGGSVGTRYH